VTADAAPDVTDVQASDSQARFEAEAIPYMRQMFPAAYRLTRDRCDAEDLIQETFARAYLKFHQFTPGTNLRAWLHRIMFHTFYSACRKRRTRPAENLAGDLVEALDGQARANPARSAEDEAIENLAGSRIMRALGELPDCFKTVIYLADVQGYHYSEIAEMMGTPIGTVMSRIHRGRHMLRTKLLAQARVPGQAGPDSASARASGPVGEVMPLPAPEAGEDGSDDPLDSDEGLPGPATELAAA
jgi:RNA polymerase sigma-70 factor, ECF subfamily